MFLFPVVAKTIIQKGKIKYLINNERKSPYECRVRFILTQQGQLSKFCGNVTLEFVSIKIDVTWNNKFIQDKIHKQINVMIQLPNHQNLTQRVGQPSNLSWQASLQLAVLNVQSLKGTTFITGGNVSRGKPCAFISILQPPFQESTV
jgi:hypothetical protein